MSHALETPLAPLAHDFRELRARGDAIVLATIVSTADTTYRKCGTQTLITASSEVRGLLSGGCLEVDLVEHAREVFATGVARRSRARRSLSASPSRSATTFPRSQSPRAFCTANCAVGLPWNSTDCRTSRAQMPQS